MALVIGGLGDPYGFMVRGLVAVQGVSLAFFGYGGLGPALALVGF